MLNQNQWKPFFSDENFGPLIKLVLETHAFGVGRERVELDNVIKNGMTTSDTFNLFVPYAGQMLEWTIMFSSNCPDLGPDFEFHDDLFLADPTVETIQNYIPSLANWQPMDPACLLNVLTELTALYKTHQIDLLGRQEPRLLMEYQLIVNEGGVQSEDVEVILTPKGSLPLEAKFFIRLDMDFSRLPGRSNKAQEDRAMLVISFQQSNWNRIIPQLYLSIPLEATFGGPSKLHIPPFRPDRCLSDYLPEVKKFIDEKIDEVAHYYATRNNFIAAILLLQRRNVIEYDAIDFTRITILLEQEDFYFLVHFHLPLAFPNDQPVVQLQSIYHMTPKDELLTMPVTYSYNGHNQILMIVKKLLSKIIEKDAVTFKRMSVSLQNCR